jgi:hypothetical protein
LDNEEGRMNLTPREERIELLLTWYVDVVEGWREGGFGSDEFGIKMMGRCWNHPSYRELHRCLIALRDEENGTYWHVRERFQAPRRTVLACPKCGDACEIAGKWFDERGNVSRKHTHGDVVFWVRKTVPAVSAAVRDDVVLRGVRWIADRFAGEPFIPDELLAKEKAA